MSPTTSCCFSLSIYLMYIFYVRIFFGRTGKREFVQAAASRLSAPGVGIQAGATLGFERRLMFQGIAALI